MVPAHGYTMKARGCFLILLMLTSFIPVTAADETGEPPQIFVDWTGGNSYLITGDVNISNISVQHISQTLELNVSVTYDTTGEHLRVNLDTPLMYGDVITISTGEVSRVVTVGTWGQPMDDHEVTLNSEWMMDQEWENENGTQKYLLVFDGQGWQQRVGKNLESWEMGNGTLLIISNTGEGEVAINLGLDSVWKNESSFEGQMTGQVFEARGSGSIGITNSDEDGDLQIMGQVSDAWINRSTIGGIIDERFRLEANGSISSISEEDDERTNLSGDIAVLLVETRDLNGERVLSHNQFEATADLVIESNDTRMDINLDTFENIERWENNQRVDHLFKMIGDGTFGFVNQDENASVQINGTIHDFHQEHEDGFVTVDDIHIDGIIVGDAQGNFGIVRTIEGEKSQANDTGSMFDVIIVHQEEWFNLTGITALPNSNLGAGSHHNESWSYDAKQSDWDNRTIRTVWTQTGPDPSSGDVLHANSPIQVNATAPEVENQLGDIEINRETGLMPIDAIAGDVFTLLGQDGMHMTVSCIESEQIAMDGHIVDTVAWDGVYLGVSGIAFGNLINDGPLSGLNVKVTRAIQFEFGEEGETVNLTENQSVNRVLSPSVISAEDNLPPTIDSITLTGGLIFNENGAPTSLEVVVSDAEFNVERVEVETYNIGGQVLQLNDKGLNGDRIIGDDIWTVMIEVPGLEYGEIELNVTAIDAFQESDNKSQNITVMNQAPRLVHSEMVPTQIHREQVMVVNFRVADGHGVSSVAVDMRDYGGDLIALEGIGELWIGEVLIPASMTPGEHSIKVMMTDNNGATSIVTRTSTTGQTYIQSEDDTDLMVRILNEPPVLDLGENRIVKIGDEDVQYTITIGVQDYDGINSVKVKLGNLAPPGGSMTWYTMTSNGNGTYSYEFTIKTYIPLGAHDLTFKSTDTYDEQTNQQILVIQLQEEDSAAAASGDESSTLTYVAIAGVGIILVLGAVIYVMRGSDGEDDTGGGLGGFGDA